MSRFEIRLSVACLLLTIGASTGQAQGFGNGGVFNDPYSLYYGLFLPRQAAIASQTTSTDIIGAAAVNRQDSMLEAERNGALFGDIQQFGSEDLDPSTPLGGRNRQRHNRVALHQQTGKGSHGPAKYYGMSNGLARYYPNLKTGMTANRNTAMTRGTFGQSGRSGIQGTSVNQSLGNSGGYR